MNTRKILRIVHLIGAVMIGTYIYSPWSNLTWFGLLMQVIVIPVLTISGIWMWKPQWFRFRNQRSSAPVIILIAMMGGLAYPDFVLAQPMACPYTAQAHLSVLGFSSSPSSEVDERQPISNNRIPFGNISIGMNGSLATQLKGSTLVLQSFSHSRYKTGYAWHKHFATPLISKL